jgi:hypothetical protein
MAQQRHSSEIVLSIDDTHVSRAINRLNEGFKGLQSGARGAVAMNLRALDRAYGGVGSELAAAGYYAGRGAMAVGSGARRVGGGVVSGLAGALPFVGAAVRPLIEARRRRTAQAQELEAIQTELMLGGGFGTQELTRARDYGRSYGLSPAQSLQAMRGFAAASQMRGAPSAALTEDLLFAERLGIGAQTIGGFARGAALGGGARGGVEAESRTAVQLASFARGRGLTGAGIAQLLARIAQSTQQMAQQGLSLDTRSMGRFVQAVDAAALQSGNKTVQGVGAVRATQRLLTMGGGALTSFKGQFGQIGQGLIQAAAARKAGSPLAMIEELERLATEPEELMGALRSMGVSEDLIQLALVGSGASTAEALSLVGAAPARRLKGRKRLPTKKDISAMAPAEEKDSILALSRAQATVDQEMISMVEQNKAASIALIGISRSLELTALNMTQTDSTLTKAIEGIDETLKDLPEAVNDLKEFLKDPIDSLTKAIKEAFR